MNQQVNLFISPLKIPVVLSSNFGELRVDHFHSGLDLRTQGTEGKEVIASADGYVYRISVSPNGFGNALYIRHMSGYSTVYGHLSRFVPGIEEYVINQQYAQKSYLVTLYPPKEKFIIKQGDIIAYSGNSGSSGGPHLHYEIRKSRNEEPVNPLLFNFNIEDNIKPVIEKLVIYPRDANTLINNQNKEKIISVTGGRGSYMVPLENEIRISGAVGFGIRTYDFLNENWNRCNVYSIQLLIDSITCFKYIMNDFAFDEARYVNSHVDYKSWIKDKITYERTFVLPNDKLGAYSDLLNNGVFNFNDGKIHKVKIIVSDINKNSSALSFSVKPPGETEVFTALESDKNSIIMPYNKLNKFIKDDIILNIPAGALYDTLYFEYQKSPSTSGLLSDIHHIHNIYTPVQNAYSLSIKPTSFPDGKESKLLIVQIDDNLKQSFAGGKYENGFVVASLTTFGNFSVGIDTIAPDIKMNFASGTDFSLKSELNIIIKDNLSGIKSYTVLIDGKWALFEYDAKNDLLTYKFDSKRLTKGTVHELEIKVTDSKDNINVEKTKIKW
jgi:hypothetical protein